MDKRKFRFKLRAFLELTMSPEMAGIVTQPYKHWGFEERTSTKDARKRRRAQ